MADRKIKLDYTAEELAVLITHVRMLEQAEKSAKKGIRAKLRKMDLYWSKLTPPKTEYSVHNLKGLFEKGILRLVDDENDCKPLHRSILGDSSKSKSDRDEHYVIDLCDEILGAKSSRQHRFDFLRGDSGRTLPVDAFYP